MLDWQRDAKPGQGYIQFCPAIHLTIYGVLLEDPEVENDGEIVWVMASSEACPIPEGGTAYRADLHVPVSKETVKAVEAAGYNILFGDVARLLYADLDRALDNSLVPKDWVCYAAQLRQTLIQAHPILACMNTRKEDR